MFENQIQSCLALTEEVKERELIPGKHFVYFLSSVGRSDWWCLEPVEEKQGGLNQFEHMP